MAQTITKCSKDIVKQALVAVPAISAEEAVALVDSPEYVFVVLRDGLRHFVRYRYSWASLRDPEQKFAAGRTNSTDWTRSGRAARSSL